MRMQKRLLAAVCLGLVVACLGAAASPETGGLAVVARCNRPAVPGAVDMSELKMEIVAVEFVTEYDGGLASFKESMPDKFRGAVVTVRVNKPKGTALTLHAADMPLHYSHGADYDVAPCKGLSVFSTAQDQDRAMTLGAGGYVKTSTRLATTAADAVYVDCFYGHMESDTSDMHILVAQPTEAAGFRTQGW